MILLKSVFIITIVTVTMIGFMVPSVFADWYVSEVNDYVIAMESDKWVLEKDLKNETKFYQDGNPISFLSIINYDVKILGQPETEYFNLINNFLSDLVGYDVNPPSYAKHTLYIDGGTAYQSRTTYVQNNGNECKVSITLIPNEDSSWIITEFDCTEDAWQTVDGNKMTESFKFSLLKEQRQEKEMQETNDIKTGLNDGATYWIAGTQTLEFKDLQLLENNDYDLLQINYVYQSDEGNSAGSYPFGSMRASSDFSLDYDSWTPYNFLTTDDATWMGTTLHGSDEWDVECPSYLGKNLNPNIPYTITACYEIPKTVNYFYFENTIFSKSTIIPYDTLRVTMAQQEKETQQAKIVQLEAELEAKEKDEQERIAQLESAQNGGGCLIATATYGSEMSQQVQQLRELRDNQLLQTESGTSFMNTFNDIYYSFSPIIADYERENPLFKEAIKIAITPMISSLSLMDNANSESEVLGIGISVIVLNLGMYLGVPAVVIVGIRKIK
jgi:hypothetical protein